MGTPVFTFSLPGVAVRTTPPVSYATERSKLFQLCLAFCVSAILLWKSLHVLGLML